jgi:hypothetical protein
MSTIDRHDQVRVGARTGTVTEALYGKPLTVEFDGGGVEEVAREAAEISRLAICLTSEGGRRIVYEDPPQGWLSPAWSGRTAEYRHTRARALRRLAECQAALLHVARREPAPTVVVPELGPGGERLLVRAYYGPLFNVPHATIIVCEYRPELLQRRAPGMFLKENAPHVREVLWSGDVGAGTQLTFVYGAEGEREAHVVHDPQLWGPKRFTAEVLAAAARCGAGVVLYLSHSDEVVTLTPEKFQSWLEQRQSRLLGLDPPDLAPEKEAPCPVDPA